MKYLSVLKCHVSFLITCIFFLHINQTTQTTQALVFGRDCLDLLHKGYTENGVYYINPDGKGFIAAYCDQKTNGGGWVVFQRRLDGSVNFYLGWNSYKEGFGDFKTEFWLGNDNIHKITAQGTQLLVELKDFNSQTVHASYGSFHVGTDAEKYVLHIAEFSGTEGDSMSNTNGMMFSTKDQDNDRDHTSCAQSYTGAWWYNRCHLSNLNGRHGVNSYGQGINWHTWKGYYYSLKESAMKVKPRRERERFYELIFSGAPSDYVLLPRITDLKDVTSCWWIKTEPPANWSTVFSLYNYDNSSVLSFSYSGNGSYLFHINNNYKTFNNYDYVITDGYWHHTCITWLSSTGSWTFYSDGIKVAEQTGLAANYHTKLGYLIIGGFEGNLTGFNMWDEHIDNVSRLKTQACSYVTGNVVAWPEVQLWRIGNITKQNTSLCKYSGFQSTIISHIPSFQDKLMGWLSASILCERYWVPCFRGPVDRWDSQVFHSKCDNKGPTVTLARKNSFLFGGFADQSWKNHSPAQSIPSKKAFLFGLQPFITSHGQKMFPLLPEKRDQAIRSDKNKGPCWGMDTQELCFSSRNVNIDPGGVFDYNGITNSNTYFTGESSFQADDVEVFVFGESFCDPPCREEETCEESTGKCVCDPALREEEMCKLRQELQDLRDKHCSAQWNSSRADCRGRLFARYDMTNINSTLGWRCYYEESLTRDRRRYDKTKASNCYQEDSGLEHFKNEVKNCRSLGMESGFISDSQIIASSEWNADHGARNARLNFQAGSGRSGSWSSRYWDVNQWLQVDFIKATTLVKVATQGRMDVDQWVTSYSLSSSMNENNFEIYQQSGAVKIFDGNSDRNTVVYHNLNPVIFTRYIRILPKAWRQHISMRAEFYNCDGYEFFEADDLLSQSAYCWTFDDVNDIKDLQGITWAQDSGSLQSTAGIRGRAVKASAGTWPIRLTEDTKKILTNPGSKQLSVSLWLLYQSKGAGVAQTFLTAGDQGNEGRGVHLFQGDGSTEELTFNLRNTKKSCSFRFGVRQRVWTHLVFTRTGFDTSVTVYRNGKVITNVAQHCHSGNFTAFPDKYIKIGSNEFPTASFDDLIVWEIALTKLQVEKLFRFYQGGPNLHVNVSVELTGQIFQSELMTSGSAIFVNKTSWLDSEIKKLYEANSILNVDNFLFWNMTYLAVNFTVRFRGTGYKEIKPLEANLVSRSMLGTTPVKFVAMEANEVYIKPLQINVNSTNSTTLAVTWSEPGQLTHGIFYGVEISYRLNGSSQKNSAMVTSRTPKYELTSLQPNTLHFISARPFTLEGEGKESDEVLAQTPEGAPSSPPLNVSGFLSSSGNIMVTWQPLPLQHHRGVIQGYSVRYTAQNTGEQQQIVACVSILSAELQNLTMSTPYSITVAAFTVAGKGPSSPVIVVRSEGVPSVPPPIVLAHSTSFSTIMVTWKAIPKEHRNGILNSYLVTLDGPDLHLDVLGCPSSSSMKIRGLEKSKVYKVQVTGYTRKGHGNFSENVIVTTNMDGCRALGMEDRNISDSHITASTTYGASFAAKNARLHHQGGNNTAGAWAADIGDVDPWLQADFGARATLVKVATQGRFDADEWVSSYSLNYGHDGTHFEVYKQSGEIKLFQGNWDRNTVVYNVVTPVIIARFIRILPKTWSGWPSMRAEFFTCEYVPSVPPPIVLAHSTSFSTIMVTWKAIPKEHRNGILNSYLVTLDGPDLHLDVLGCPSSSSMKIRGLEKSKVYKVQVTGYTRKGHGNFSENVIVTTNMDGCRALGMEDRNISDSHITASTTYGASFAAKNARLHHQGGNNTAGAWAADIGDVDPWLQADFGARATLVKVATQGRFDADEWVSSYSLNYGHDGTHFEVYKQSGEIKLFQGNWDRNTVVYNVVTPVIIARFIRILPKTWSGWPSMRAEFFTCEYEVNIDDPVNITNTAPSSTSVGLSWKAPDPYKLVEAVSEYRVEIIDLLRRERFNYTVNSSMTNVELDFLKPFTSYEFKVFGSTSSWQGNITDTISLKTQEDAPSEPPRNLSVQHSTASQTTLQWKPVHEYSINGRLQGYKVRYKQTESPTWKTISISVNATQQSRRKRSVADGAVTFNLGGLKAYTNYSVIVLAFTIKDGAPTLATNFTTAEDVPDDSPTNVTAYNTSSTSINVTWQPIPPGHVNGMLLAYHVIYQRVDKVNDNISLVIVNSTSLNTELTGLGKYKLYSIQIAGRTVAGLGNFSRPVFVRTEQDVPDDPPSNIRAIGTEPTVIKAHWLPVSNETINGIGLGYKLALFTAAGENTRNYTLNASVLSLEITGLEIWTNYSIKMSAFTIVGDGPWSDALTEDTDEQAPFKPPANLTGKATSSTSIFVEWGSVVLPNLRGILRGYMVYYQEAPGSVHPSVLRNVTVAISVSETQLDNLQKYTKYHIWVTAFTTREGWLSNSIFVRTHEDIPERPPLYITYSLPSSASILIRWGPVPPQYKNGIVRGFKVEYQENQPGATAEVKVRMLVNWALIGELKKFTIYSIRVQAFTSIGYGPENNITVLTAQDVPSKPPNSINAESHVTLTTIPVTWQPIDPYHIHGVLLGYKIRYQAIAIGQEPMDDQPIREERVNASTLSVVLTNLELFTLYRVDVLGYTIMGNGPSATDYAETCRCHKRLTTSWYEFRPYVHVSENKIPSGLIPPILGKLVVTCCETCQSHGTSYVDLNLNGFNLSAKLPDLRTLKSRISSYTDFFFPVYGFKDQTHFAKEFGYHGLVQSPGMAYIVKTNSLDDMPNAILMNIASCWPAVTLALAITYLAGLFVWLVESQYNQEDFPPSFVEGASEGFYWAFVSMTTVGYGDRAPISVPGRFLATAVILSGLVIFGLVNGIMATSITTVTLQTDYKIYGTKVAAIARTPEYRMGIRKNARMDTDQEYHTFEAIYRALHERKVIGALIDTYSAGSSKDMFAEEHLRVNKILDYSSTYGVVMGKEARKLRLCFKDSTQHAFANEISHHIQKNTEQLKEPPNSLPVERSTGIFDSNSTLFQFTLFITSTLLISCLLIGIIYEIIRRVRARAKVQPHDLRKTFLVEMKEIVDNFKNNMNVVKTALALRHEQERKKLLMAYKQRPSGKYSSTAALTKGLYLDAQYDGPEVDC